MFGRLRVSELICSGFIMESSLGHADRTNWAISYWIWDDLQHCRDLIRPVLFNSYSLLLLRHDVFTWWILFGCYLQPMDVGWQIVLGSLIGFFGAAFGSVGGVGGGGIFVPMLTLIIGFDPKSSTAISKCEDLTASCGSFLLCACSESNSFAVHSRFIGLV